MFGLKNRQGAQGGDLERRVAALEEAEQRLNAELEQLKGE